MIISLNGYFDIGFSIGIIEDNSLVCMNTGMNLYRGVRDDLKFYFGNEFIAEM